MKKYIHYGSTKFEPEKFEPIQNRLFVKPTGGFWASPIETEWGWKDWCEAENYEECEKENSFTFTLSENANVLHLHNVEDLDSLPKLKLPEPLKSLSKGILGMVYLDFEKILKSGYDAIEIHLEDFSLESLYGKLYGWDCDSILIMNPEIIKEVK